jgi:hypothetical protein
VNYLFTFVETVLLIGTMIVVLSLVALLTTKEAVQIVRPKGLLNITDSLNAAIVPMSTMFFIIILLRLLQMFSIV